MLKSRDLFVILDVFLKFASIWPGVNFVTLSRYKEVHFRQEQFPKNGDLGPGPSVKFKREDFRGRCGPVARFLF